MFTMYTIMCKFYSILFHEGVCTPCSIVITPLLIVLIQICEPVFRVASSRRPVYRNFDLFAIILLMNFCLYTNHGCFKIKNLLRQFLKLSLNVCTSWYHLLRLVKTRSTIILPEVKGQLLVSHGLLKFCLTHPSKRFVPKFAFIILDPF
jgi:hypothetical protein